MELSLEAYRLIVKYVKTRADICSLCRTSREFRHVAERALYNTIYVQDPMMTIVACNTLSSQPRVSTIVDALTISVPEEEDIPDRTLPLPDGYWHSIARALQAITQLHHLNIHLTNDRGSSKSWILSGCTFQLWSFHCDLEWDHALVRFLQTQRDLKDLYIDDYRELTDASINTSLTDVSTLPSSLNTHSLPNLSTLECTFAEAAMALAPGRPLTRLKTCFSRSQIDEKRAEMTLLLSKLRLTTSSFCALDISDSSYTENYSLELLSLIVSTLRTDSLCYLGTLVLPIGGRERLQFYGFLRRLPQLQCVEIEVSGWEPAPTSRAALRALTIELRLYCPSINHAIFVHEYERAAVTVINGLYVIDDDTSTENLWREL